MADQVRVYALLNPAQLVAERQAIQQIVFRLLRITNAAAHSFTIAESSGWISYVALEELWTRRYPPVLPGLEEARTRAESFPRTSPRRPRQDPKAGRTASRRCRCCRV
jgi:hypothetical protein